LCLKNLSDNDSDEDGIVLGDTYNSEGVTNNENHDEEDDDENNPEVIDEDSSDDDDEDDSSEPSTDSDDGEEEEELVGGSDGRSANNSDMSDDEHHVHGSDLVGEDTGRNGERAVNATNVAADGGVVTTTDGASSTGEGNLFE